MRKKDFLIEVKVELDHIKNHATDEEKGKLDFTNFSHSNGDECIYGQMTGNCGSERAKELFTKSYLLIDRPSKKPRMLYSEIPMMVGDRYTALEKYLFLVSTANNNKSNKHRKVIEYIKGNLDEIVL